MKTLLFTLVIFLLFTLSIVFAADVTLEWDPNPATDLAGYHLYQAARIGDKTSAWSRITQDLFTNTVFVVTGLDDNNYAWSL